VFSTAEDNQPAVTVHVLQGEREMAADNKTLGRFELTGIPPAPRGTPQIEVSFDIDANGIVSVAAKDMASGKEQSIRITASSGLDQTEIDRLIKEAEMNADTDRRKKGLVDARNEADGLVYTTSKSLADLGDKIDAGSRQQAEAAVASLKAAMAGEDTAEIRRLTDELKHIAHRLAESVYNTTGAPGAAPRANGRSAQQDPGGTQRPDDVVDAEFEEVA
ncbi:MAG: Hsp70 family protein, partial [Desulfobacterales bacterium]